MFWLNGEAAQWHVQQSVSSLIGVCVRRLLDAGLAVQPGSALCSLGGLNCGGFTFAVASPGTGSLKSAIIPVLEVSENDT